MYPHAIFLTYFKGQSHPLAVVYDIAGTMLTWVAMQYAGVAFEIRDVRRIFNVWSSWYFLPHIIAVSLLVLFNIFPEHRSTGDDDKTQTVNKKIQ